MPIEIKRLVLVSLLLFIFFPCINSFAQTNKVDDLLAQLDKNAPDTVQIKLLRKLSAAYSAVDPVKKFYYANQYKLLAEKNGIDSSVANAYLDMGISYGIRSKIDSALYYFKLGFEKAKTSNYLSGIARGYTNIGYASDLLDRKKEAVKNYEEALKIYRKLNIKKGINQCIINLGSIYFDIEEYKTADIYFKQVLENVKQTPADEIGLGNALFSLGNSNRVLNNEKIALQYYLQSLAIREKIGDINGIALSNWGLGLLSIQKKEYQKALGYLDIALKNNRSLKNVNQESLTLRAIAEAYLGLKDYKNAEANAKLSLVKAKEGNSKIITSLILKLLVKINQEQKKVEETTKFELAYKAVSDSLDLKKTKKEVFEGDLHRINSDNKSLEKDNKTIKSINADYITVIAVISILLILVIILLLLYYQRNLEKKATNLILQKQKQEIAEVNEELGALNEELTTQMDIISTQNIELEKLNAVKNKFFSVISHDLRSPINSLKMLFELYRKGDLEENELGGFLNQLGNNIQNTANFLDNLLEWSKSQLEGMVVKPSNFLLKGVIDENIQLMDSQIKLKGLKVENKIDAAINVFADPNMITVVVRNLLANAIKFCHTGDEVLIDAIVKNKEVSFFIKDNGPGINTTDQKNLFNLSHTASTGTAGERGHHIGLILCKDMVQQNNGNISVESELGLGTTFYINLPTSN